MTSKDTAARISVAFSTHSPLRAAAPTATPDRPGVHHVANKIEPTLCEDPRRGVGPRRRLRPNEPHPAAAERVRDERLGGFRGIPSPLESGHDAVGDLDPALVVKNRLDGHCVFVPPPRLPDA